MASCSENNGTDATAISQPLTLIEKEEEDLPSRSRSISLETSLFHRKRRTAFQLALVLVVSLVDISPSGELFSSALWFVRYDAPRLSRPWGHPQRRGGEEITYEHFSLRHITQREATRAFDIEQVLSVF